MLNKARSPKELEELSQKERNTGFIDHEKLRRLSQTGDAPSLERCREILQSSMKLKALALEEAAELLRIDTDEKLELLLEYAGKVKRAVYGNRVVLFAPLYISNYCINNCTYCGYRRDNKFARKRLSQEELAKEVQVLEKMGHKRLALEAGEDPVNCDLPYVLECINTIYSSGDIRRINVNVAASPIEDYRRLKEAEIGTYILFQETYDFERFAELHPKSLKGDYLFHLESFDRAMQAGIEDVGGGVLFGLSDYRFEVLALLEHNRHLEELYGVGFHTVSVPRLKKSEGMKLEDYPEMLSDWDFRKIVAVLRLAVPYTGLILSTRESAELRRELLDAGVSQISAGSCTGVGGYYREEQLRQAAIHAFLQQEGEGPSQEPLDSGLQVEVPQFSTEDHRSPLEVVKDLTEHGFMPSFCTACYRQGRTGDRFMSLARSGEIKNVCAPNAIMTFAEFARDYGDDELRARLPKIMQENIAILGNTKIREVTEANLEKIKQKQSDIFF